MGLYLIDLPVFNTNRKKEAILARRPVTPAYVIFYILFLQDTWRILTGVLVALIIEPNINDPDTDALGRAIIFVMIAAIGYAVSGYPARLITRGLKRWFTHRFS